jgi:hypothetical protein
MTVYEIPLTPEPQTFSISLVGTVYQMTINWNQYGSYWVLDIADAQGNDILCGLPLLPGFDIFGQYQYLGFGGQLFVQTDFDPVAPPTYTNLGVTSHLYFSVAS